MQTPVIGVVVGMRFGADLQTKETGGHGRTVMLPQDRPTLLYIFSPLCRHCEANEPAIQLLFQKTQGRVLPVRLSLTDRGLEGYIKGYHISGRVYVATESTIRLYHLAVTPQCVAISHGRAERVWNGEFGPQQVSEIERYFHISLKPCGSGKVAEGACTGSATG